jgi:DNA (cytosine-5)-methyltransferase 1
MRIGSLFSGIGGIELGLERAGMTTVWQVEKDEYARKVLAKHWPHVRRFEDVCAVHGGMQPHATAWCNGNCLDDVDIICGGFPCQDISVAGKGKGIAGERSGLWREFARIVDEIRPSWVIIENVPALRSRGLGTVLGDLAALGYDAEWDCLPASAFGAPHRRDRIFVVAHTKRVPIRVEQGWGGGPSRQRTLESRCDGEASDVADTNGQGELQPRGRIFEERGRPRDCGCPCQHTWATEPDVGRVAHGVPSRVDRLKCLGNAVVPQVAEHVGRMIMRAGL